MTKVTYRGVEYNAEEYNASVLAEAAQRDRHELMYRGIKVNSKASPCSQNYFLTNKNVPVIVSIAGIFFCYTIESNKSLL